MEILFLKQVNIKKSAEYLFMWTDNVVGTIFSGRQVLRDVCGSVVNDSVCQPLPLVLQVKEHLEINMALGPYCSSHQSAVFTVR